MALLRFIFLCVPVVLLSFSVIPRVNSGNLQIQFQHEVNGSLLRLDTATYQNAFSQSFQISKFKYYVGNFELKNVTGKVFRSNEYFLIDEENALSKLIALKNIPAGQYTEIGFTLGVDSLHNCSGAQSGALDPIHGMFWDWNTGYIFLKLEGRSNFCNTAHHFFEYHIGGYKKEHNCIRKIVLPLHENLSVGSDKKSILSVRADVGEVLKNPTAIDFAQLPSVTNHTNATTMADNYADIFSIH